MLSIEGESFIYITALFAFGSCRGTFIPARLLRTILLNCLGIVRRSRDWRVRLADELESSRRDRIRTCGPCLPKAVLYQAELLSDVFAARLQLEGATFVGWVKKADEVSLLLKSLANTCCLVSCH